MRPDDTITCETCGGQNCEKVPDKKKKRVIKKENIRREKDKENHGAYRVVFSRDSRSHNRTDVNDRNLNNIYGDARERRQQDAEEEKIPRSRLGQRRPPSGTENSGPNIFNRAGSFQFSNTGSSSGIPPRAPDSRRRERAREQPNHSNTFSFRPDRESNPYSPFGNDSSPYEQQTNSRGGARRRLASPAVIFQAFFGGPQGETPIRGFSFVRETGANRGVSPDNFSQTNFFQGFGIFNHLFQELVGDIFNQESFMHNFNSNFRSSDIFENIIQQSMQSAQEEAKKPASKQARK